MQQRVCVIIFFSVSGADGDYVTLTRTLTFPAESVTASATVTTREDDTQEGPESFTATLSDPTNGLSLGTTTSATVDIIDDDGKAIFISVDSRL